MKDFYILKYLIYIKNRSGSHTHTHEIQGHCIDKNGFMCIHYCEVFCFKMRKIKFFFLVVSGLKKKFILFD